jgi:outer membrane lipopolysaccharide assembly protein LptE/RlpB
LKNLKTILIIFTSLLITSCGIYTLKDVSIDYSKIKTIKIGFIENKARYINPQLSPRLTDKLQQKIVSQTKLVRTNNDDAHLQISGYISNYDVSTAAIANNQAASNRLTVTVHVVVKNTVENTNEEYDISRNFDFSANLSLQQAENQLLDEIIRNVTDEIFNKLFSNW